MLRAYVLLLLDVFSCSTAGIMAFCLFGETPAPAFYAASALVVLNHNPRHANAEGIGHGFIRD